MQSLCGKACQRLSRLHARKETGATDELEKYHTCLDMKKRITGIPCLLLFIFMIGTGACSRPEPAATERRLAPWREAKSQLLKLREEKRPQEMIALSRSKLLLLEEEAPAAKGIWRDSLAAYARFLLSACHNAYLDSKQYAAGIACMDTLKGYPFLHKEALYELLCAQAGLNQLAGNNNEAIRLADEYLSLPTCPDDNRFLTQAEIISGVYVYCSNDLPKAISILERAMEAYRRGGNCPNLVRLISRLGIYYRLTGAYEKAVATNQEAISSYDAGSMSPRNVVIAYGEQANLFGELEMYDRALQMNERAQYYSQLKDSFGLGDLYRYRVELFEKTGNRDSAYHYLRLAEEVSARQKSFKGVFVSRVMRVAAYLEDTDSLPQALRLAQSLCPDTVRMPQWAKYQLELQLGKALLKSGRETEGVRLMEHAVEGFARMDLVELEASANKELMDYYLGKRMDSDFIRSYRRNRAFADSLASNETLRAVAAANIRFETQQKEEENKWLSTTVALQRKQLLYHICISIALLLLLLAVAAYLLIRRKANRLQLESNRREIQELITRQQDLNRRNEQLTKQIEQAMATNNLTAIRQLTVQNLLSKEDENTFRKSFATLHPSYLPRLRERYPRLTRNEELLAMLICMNQSTDEVALIMGINRNSVNVMRSRMRKNMELSKEQALDEELRRYLS